ncbi:hypothetical protein C8F04DRAFT_1184056 [Mycena alexandri]|uniref:Uncharacterized protein n=1 Tax=Mycena alexandri TaxID=1745969 RepID=A0AAD6STU6_9AGAR|nr:hypothetical protein C8F04DRAFT_1184056 [Mycena alexandri]
MNRDCLSALDKIVVYQASMINPSIGLELNRELKRLRFLGAPIVLPIKRNIYKETRQLKALSPSFECPATLPTLVLLAPTSTSAALDLTPVGPDLSSPIYAARKESGLYDSIADQLLAMGPNALANLDYPTTIKRQIEDWSKNHRYVDVQGEDLQVAVVGEIHSPAAGTIIRAHGNFYARDGDNFKPIDDKSKIKDVIALGVPTCASTKMHNTFLNQIIVGSQITSDNADEDARAGKYPIVKNWSKPSEGGFENHEILLISTLPKYGVRSFNLSRDSVLIIIVDTLGCRLDEVDEAFTATVVGDDDTKEFPGPEDIRVGAHYEPSLLCDYGGAYFNHVKAKLVQLDIRDMDKELIPPWKIYQELKPGTLVLALCSLHCFNMVDTSGKEVKERKIYQMNAHSIRVLSKSDDYTVIRTRPIAPNSGERVSAALPERAIPSAFANFVLPPVASTSSQASTSRQAVAEDDSNDMAVEETPVDVSSARSKKAKQKSQK